MDNNYFILVSNEIIRMKKDIPCFSTFVYGLKKGHDFLFSILKGASSAKDNRNSKQTIRKNLRKWYIQSTTSFIHQIFSGTSPCIIFGIYEQNS